jgi:hypothetical protein
VSQLPHSAPAAASHPQRSSADKLTVPVRHRYMQIEAMAGLASPDPDAETLGLPPLAA